MDKWSKEEMTLLRQFWQGDIGKKYMKRIKDTRKQLLQSAMASPTSEEASRWAWIANGFDSVLQDIEAVVNNVDKKKEGATKKK